MTGYLRTIKTAAVTALQQSFAITYPENDPAGGIQPAYVSVEFPVNAAQVPAIWVDYEPAMLQTAGVNYTEVDGNNVPVTRWRFQGHAVFDIIAFSSNERDLIYDELIALVAFAAQSDVPSTFRQNVENNNLVDTTWSFDQIESRAESAAPGTPWGSDEWIYERGIALQIVGDFATDPQTGALVDLREILVTGTDEEDGNATTLSIGGGIPVA